MNAQIAEKEAKNNLAEISQKIELVEQEKTKSKRADKSEKFENQGRIISLTGFCIV